MSKQTKSCKSLGGSRAGISIYRLCTLTLVAVLASGGAVLGFAQDQPEAPKPAKQVVEKEKKPATESTEKVVGGYTVHQSVELGGRITANKTGSSAMWATMVNQGTGMRVLGHSLEMHSMNPSKTPFFDTLTSGSFGYGGDPYDVSYLKFSKGRWYDFAGNFRRDRNYFDYNLLANSLLGPTALVPETHSLHLFNTVRRNTDTLLTLMPLSRVNFRAGFNHGTHEGPTYSTAHNGGDVQLFQWFRNSLDTYTGGVDVKLAKRTTLSYDQFYALYKGDSSFNVTGVNYEVGDITPGIPPTIAPTGQMVSLGVNTLVTATCGTGTTNPATNTRTTEIYRGLVNEYCSATMTQSQVAPTRTTFPTEQLRFSSRYWERVAMNGRVTYSGGVSDVNNYNATFVGLNSRLHLRQEIDTGGLGGGRLAHNKRINVNADYGAEAELNKYVSVSDQLDYWNFRIPSYSSEVAQTWTGTASASLLTPLGSITPASATSTFNSDLNQKNLSNTVLGIFTVTPEFKFSAGWRFNSREIKYAEDDPLTWHENWMLLGAVIQPTRTVRMNVNYDTMNSKNANSQTPSNTYTREAPNRIYHFRARVRVTPVKWINFAVTGNDFSAQNNDPNVNHHEHKHDFSFATQIIPTETFSLDLNYAHDDVFSSTDLCYVSSLTATGAVSTGTCTYGPAGTNAANTLVLGTGYYDTPTTYFAGSINYSPSKYLQFNGGAMVNSVSGRAEQLNPQMVPGALDSKVVSPFADLAVQIAPEWTWHGNWQHHSYNEGGAAGPAPRDFYGEVITLGVKYAF